MATVDHERFLLEIADYLVSQIDEERVNGLAYKGLLPPINSRDDFQHFPNSLFPFVGVAPLAVQYLDQALGKYYPTYRLQVLYSSRESGIDPVAMMSDMLHFTQQMETILIKTIRNDRFGMSQYIEGANLEDMGMFPTFYTSIDKNRKAYSIAFFTISLYMGGL